MRARSARPGGSSVRGGRLRLAIVTLQAPPWIPVFTFTPACGEVFKNKMGLRFDAGPEV